MASRKAKQANRQCKRSGHTLRFLRYVGERDYNYPDNHEKYNPKTGVFKCCNCSHEEVRMVRIRHTRPALFGEEQYFGIPGVGGFFSFKRREE